MWENTFFASIKQYSCSLKKKKIPLKNDIIFFYHKLDKLINQKSQKHNFNTLEYSYFYFEIEISNEKIKEKIQCCF